MGRWREGRTDCPLRARRASPIIVQNVAARDRQIWRGLPSLSATSDEPPEHENEAEQQQRRYNEVEGSRHRKVAEVARTEGIDQQGADHKRQARNEAKHKARASDTCSAGAPPGAFVTPTDCLLRAALARRILSAERRGADRGKYVVLLTHPWVTGGPGE